MVQDIWSNSGFLETQSVLILPGIDSFHVNSTHLHVIDL